MASLLYWGASCRIVVANHQRCNRTDLIDSIVFYGRRCEPTPFASDINGRIQYFNDSDSSVLCFGLGFSSSIGLEYWFCALVFALLLPIWVGLF